MRRAEKRGKELPLLLKAVLEAQADSKLLVTSEQDFQSAGFIGKASPSAGNIGFEEEVATTLKAEQVTHVIESVSADNCKCLTSWDCQSKRIFDENGVYPCLQAMDCGGANNTAVLKAEILDMTHANDVIGECGEISPTLQARMGTGGNQIPLVFEPTYCIQGNTIDRSDTAGANGKGVIEGKSYTLNTVDRPAVAYAVGIQPNNSVSAGGLSDIEEKSPTLPATKLAGVCYARSGFGEFVESETTGTLRASAAEHGVSSQDVVVQAVAYNGENITSPQNAANPKIGDPCHADVAGALNCMHDQQSVMACYPINTQIVTRSNKLSESTEMGIGEDGDPAYTLQEAHSHGVICAIDCAAFNQDGNSNSNNDYCYQKTVGALCARDYKGVGSQYVSEDKLVCEPCSYNSFEDDIVGTLDAHYYLGCGARGGKEREFVSTPIDIKNNFCVWIVRRLTPLECERLQGFPDAWTKYDTKGNEIKDTPRYKACGNSIAIPCAVRVFQGIVEAERGA